MSEGEGFLEDVCAYPEDDTPRLVYADWLEERQEPGDEDRAQFIRMQCSLASDFDCTTIGRPALTPERAAELRAKAESLLDGHREAWEQPLYELGVTDVSWSRGFPEYVAISAEAFINRGAELFAQAPITGARITPLPQEQVQALANCPHLAALTSLNLGYNDIGNAGAAALANSHLRLTTLNLWNNGIGNAGATALANSPHLAALTSLNLWNNGIGNAGATALANSPHLAALTSLNLGHNYIGNAAAAALAESPHLAALTSLDLWGNNIGAAGATALASSEHLAALTSLNLGYNDIGNAGAEALANSLHLRLTTLNLWNNGIGNAGATALASSEHLAALTSLNLGYNDIGNAGRRALAASPHFRPGMTITIEGFQGTFAEFQRRERSRRCINGGPGGQGRGG